MGGLTTPYDMKRRFWAVFQQLVVVRIWTNWVENQLTGIYSSEAEFPSADHSDSNRLHSLYRFAQDYTLMISYEKSGEEQNDVQSGNYILPACNDQLTANTF